MMSANITAASTPWRAHRLQRHLGAQLRRAADLEEPCRSRSARYSGSERPACRMNHTGVRSTGSRRAARTSRGADIAAYTSRGDAQRSARIDVPAGPLAVRWRGWELSSRRAPAPRRAVEVELENAGSAPWRGRERLELGYHWLDDRGNPIVWDGLWAPLPPRSRPASASSAARRGARAAPPRAVPARARPRRRGPLLVLRARQRTARAEVDVAPRIAAGARRRLHARRGELVAAATKRSGARTSRSCRAARRRRWRISRRAACPRRTGRGACSTRTRRATRSSPASSRPPGWRRPHDARAGPGTGRVPGFAHPLLCPSLVPGIEPAWDWSEVEGLPALAHPPREPWLYDGRIAAQSSTAIRSSTRLKTHAPSASATTAATTR